jgi:hypothetical protein
MREALIYTKMLKSKLIRNGRLGYGDLGRTQEAGQQNPAPDATKAGVAPVAVPEQANKY